MNVLVCPLDWGLGHASRCIPLIRALRERHEVIVAAGGPGRSLLEREFPGLRVLDFPGYRIRYSASPPLFFPVLLLQAPAFLLGLRREALTLERLAEETQAGCVISDGRYGCRSRSRPSVLVTHQIFLRAPGGPAVRRLLFALHARLLRRFHEVWVPDHAGEANLSGELGHGPHGLSHLRYLGPLSRFPGPVDAQFKIRPDVLAVVSGPEPQRSLFEAALRRALAPISGTRVLVRGLPGAGGPSGLPVLRAGELNVFDHLDGPALEALFRSAGLVVSRSGYTTVMELAALGLTRMAFVPTPGQTEQEYLADHLQALGVAPRLSQEGLDLAAALSAGGYSGFAAMRGASPPLADFLSRHPLLGGAPAP